MFLRQRTTPIGALHRAIMGWGQAERTSSRLAVQRWLDGVAYVDVQARNYADYWTQQNQSALAAGGPLWVVLGDSTAQGLGASSPLHGYVGQVLNALRRTGTPWRVLNLSRSGAQTRHVLDDQLPLLEGLQPALVTCGIGSNDILATPPKRFRDHLKQVIGRLPSSSVVMDLTVPDRLWRVGGAVSPYVSGINQHISTTAADRGLPVAEVSRYARPPWRGMLAPDNFHPNNLGYRRHADALLMALQTSGVCGPSASSR
ncbi:SGNH/GDSL hydrolase family protein [Kribbella antibiotica]|uniref:SGNH/GDSL hydrolase family protein n=1 Tax=Kribbella antibiotica TaxID=190195 RepID=A0A4R4YXH7_9ACTN|nr:SGNH/GDSL hydrolase family protein [Kribbella antibiotica]TDD50198.1 SGNH/GDSL hydrolase family protein [Kribbella antibiotica]